MRVVELAGFNNRGETDVKQGVFYGKIKNGG
jgi:hypothetical protein